MPMPTQPQHDYGGEIRMMQAKMQQQQHEQSLERERFKIEMERKQLELIRREREAEKSEKCEELKREIEAERKEMKGQQEKHEKEMNEKLKDSEKEHKRKLEVIQEESDKKYEASEAKRRKKDIEDAAGGIEWEEVKFLASGGFGDVCLWVHRESKEERAVKKLRAGTDAETVSAEEDQFKKEIKVLEKYKHENIVKYYGTDKIHNTICIFMEYMSQGSIRRLLDDSGPIHLGKAKKYIIESLNGLEYLHSNGIIHGDIKCGNILLNSRNIAKLCDFGTAKFLSGLMTATCSKMTNKNMAGTMCFMAPEQFKRSVKRTPAADIWSMACTLVEMLTTNPPWHDIEIQELMMEISEKARPTYKLPDGTPPQAEESLSKCFCYNPEDRLSAKQLLQEPILAS